MNSLNIHLLFHPTVRKGYRIQADKDRDSMKVLYYVEKELAQFDPTKRMRERCEKKPCPAISSKSLSCFI